MAAGWTRRTFDSDGVTEHPTGPHLQRLRERSGGAVVLALDVSGSMTGDRIATAVIGCRRFIDEAVGAGYRVGLTLWHHGVADSVAPAADPAEARKLLDRARTNGGNDLVPCLELAQRQLMAVEAADRVLAVFGDGDLGNRQRSEAKAAELSRDGIRILTCGLGEGSAQALAAVSTEGDERAAPRTASDATLADSIAAMARGLTRGR
ncbi:VWA domain-containing protein [Nocardiopsis valliformis]|uniref:VWA domain-containing protein n=1 Tax=Nocardiopsis valliformis TaxID=239974 RepID=UPI0003476C62|nr:vWA domain-containing protein [Nocardiopsis valliformis]